MARKPRSNNEQPPADEFAGYEGDDQHTAEQIAEHEEEHAQPPAEEEGPTDEEIRNNALHGEHEAGAHVTDLLDAEEARQAAEENNDVDTGEHVFDPAVTIQDTDNTHQDGGNGFMVEHYHDANTATDLALEEARNFDPDAEASNLHPGEIARRINLASTSAVHGSLAPFGRDPTIVGPNPLTEKGLRPPAPLDMVDRTDDAGRPYDGDHLHTVDKGYPGGMGVNEHIAAPTATGAVPEGLQVKAAVPVEGVKLDPRRIEGYQRRAGDLKLTPQHVSLIDAALHLARSGAREFTLAQTGGNRATADDLENAGIFEGKPVLGAENFPQSGRMYRIMR